LERHTPNRVRGKFWNPGAGHLTCNVAGRPHDDPTSQPRVTRCNFTDDLIRSGMDSNAGAAEAARGSPDRARSIVQNLVNVRPANGCATKHWTGTDQPLAGLIRVDSTTYRFLGGPARTVRTLVMEQADMHVTPTRFPGLSRGG